MSLSLPMWSRRPKAPKQSQTKPDDLDASGSGADAWRGALVALITFLYGAERRYPGSQRRREYTEGLARHAWRAMHRDCAPCVWRAGDDGTDQESPLILIPNPEMRVAYAPHLWYNARSARHTTFAGGRQRTRSIWQSSELHRGGNRCDYSAQQEPGWQLCVRL